MVCSSHGMGALLNLAVTGIKGERRGGGMVQTRGKFLLLSCDLCMLEMSASWG